MYKVIYKSGAQKQLNKLDLHVKKRIIEWINENLEGTDHPRSVGKPLSYGKSGQWSYRVNNYRIIAEINDNEIVIYVISVGHRRNIYD